MVGLEIDGTWKKCKLTEHVYSTPPFTSYKTLLQGREFIVM